MGTKFWESVFAYLRIQKSSQYGTCSACSLQTSCFLAFLGKTEGGRRVGEVGRQWWTVVGKCSRCAQRDSRTHGMHVTKKLEQSSLLYRLYNLLVGGFPAGNPPCTLMLNLATGRKKWKGKMTISEVSAALVEKSCYLHWLKTPGGM